VVIYTVGTCNERVVRCIEGEVGGGEAARPEGVTLAQTGPRRTATGGWAPVRSVIVGGPGEPQGPADEVATLSREGVLTLKGK